jgi:hypothetical protein
MRIKTIGTILSLEDGVATIRYGEKVHSAHKLADALMVVATERLTVKYMDGSLSVTVDTGSKMGKIFEALEEAHNNPEICAIGPCP